MRHSYIDGPRRIRAPRATPRSRVRFVPALLALPVVAVLWVAVGLPVLSQVTGAAASNRLSRNVAFATEAGGAGGSSAGGSSAPQTVAAAAVSKQVLAAYHAEVARRARARAAATTKARTNGRFDLPQLTLPSSPAGTATLATVDGPSSSPTPSQQSSTPPAKDSTPAPGGSGSSGGSGDNGGTTSPGTGTGGLTPPAGPGPGSGSSSGSGAGDTGGGDSGGWGTSVPNTGDAGDIGGSAASGGTGGTPPPPAPPPPPPPAPPTPPPPPTFPAPADIQTWNGGGPHGKPKAGDAMVFVFASAPDPAAVLAGWDGSATTVTFQISDNGTNDVATVLNSGGAQLTALGSVSLGGDYANRQNVTASGSTMFLWGKMIVVVLGTPTGKTGNQTKAGTMVWTTPAGSATESGTPDNEF